MKYLNVAYSIPSWLPLTMHWVYNQIRYQPEFVPLILTDLEENLEILPNFPIASLKTNLARKTYRTLHRFGIRPTPRAYESALIQYRPRLLHSHFGDRAWYDIPLVNKYKMKHIVTFYGYDLSLLPQSRPYWNSRYQSLFQSAQRFQCEGPHMASKLVELGCPAEKIQVHHLGIDLEVITCVPRQFSPGETLKILIAGRFIEKKGIPYALKACGELRKIYPNIEITLIGDSSGTLREESEKSHINDAICEYQLDSVIKILGYQPYKNLLNEAYQCHLFLSPSVTAADGDAEGGLPVVIIELLASGMPVISSYHCDIPEVIEHNKTGLLAPERDIQKLTQHLAWLIDHPDRWEEMVRKGRQYVELEFNARTQGKKLISIYNEIINLGEPA